MGLIQMAKNAVGTAFQDQIREYLRAPAFDGNTLMAPAIRVRDGQTVNNGNIEIISDGSYFDVAQGQCLIILEDGKIREMIAAGESGVDDAGQPVTGQFQFKTDAAPSLFGTSSFKKRIIDSMKDIGDRFATGGMRHHTFMAFYINLKPLTPIKVGVGNIDFTDAETGISIEVSAHGQICPQIVNPALFYARCVMDPQRPFTFETNGFGANIKERLKSTIKMMFGSAASEDMKFSKLQSSATRALINYMSQDASETSFAYWGFSVVEATSALEIDVNDEDKQMIQDLQRARFRGSSADILRAEASTAMDHAASNANGAAMGMMGIGMMGNMNGMNGFVPNVGNMSVPGGPGSYVPPLQQSAPQHTPAQQPIPQSIPAQQPTFATQQFPQGEQWTCSCGQTNTMGFCVSCGKKKPQPQAENATWTCACGAINTMKFCGKCGQPKPEHKKKLHCDKCGYEPGDGSELKFCPNCGDPFTELDLV